MKKFISSVLVFALMGVPAVSSAFAAKVGRATNNYSVSDVNNKKQEEAKKKTGMSTATKLLIAGGILAVIVGAGYSSYNYCPAVKDLIDSKFLPYAKDLAKATQTKANGYYDSAKNLLSDAAAKTKNLGDTVKTKASGYLNSMKNSMSNATASAKNFGNIIKTKASGCLNSTKSFMNDKVIPPIKNCSAVVNVIRFFNSAVNGIKNYILKGNSDKNTAL